MPNFKVFNDQASALLAQVSNPTAASLLAQVSNPTPASLLAQVSNPTAASLLAQVSNPTPASLLAQVSNPTPASLQVQVSNPTAASLLAAITVQDRRTADSLTDVADTGDTTFKDAVVVDVLEFSTVTFAARNSGTSNSALVRLQLSADSVLFDTDTTGTITLAPTTQFFFVPYKFVKYAKIQYASQTAALTTSLSIFLQAHV